MVECAGDLFQRQLDRWRAQAKVPAAAASVRVDGDVIWHGGSVDDASASGILRVPGSHPPAVTPSYGMGIMADLDGPFGASYGHGGGGPGYSLFAEIVPRSSRRCLSVALFCNRSAGADARHGAHELLRLATTF